MTDELAALSAMNASLIALLESQGTGWRLPPPSDAVVYGRLVGRSSDLGRTSQIGHQTCIFGGSRMTAASQTEGIHAAATSDRIRCRTVTR